MNNLALKSFLGILNLAVMMGFALFLSAGTIHYQEAWSYLLIFFGGVIFITVYVFNNDKRLLQSRLKVGAPEETRTIQKIVQGIATVGFLGLFVIAGFDHRFHWSHVPLWLSIVSNAFIILSMIFLFVVFRKNTYLSSTIEVQKGQHVIDDGPYAIVRHPMYSAVLMLFAFTPLSLGSYLALITLPLMAGVLVVRCVDEEQALKTELPGYTDYCKKVRYRLVPGIY